MNSAMRIQTEKADREEEEQQKLNIERSINYNLALTQQLEELEQKKQQDYEQFLKEKLLVDEVVQKINEENERYYFWLFKVKLESDWKSSKTQRNSSRSS